MSDIIISSTTQATTVIPSVTDYVIVLVGIPGSAAAAALLTTEELTATGDPKVFTSSATPVTGSKTMALDGTATMTEGFGYTRSGATWTFTNTPVNTPVGVYTA